MTTESQATPIDGAGLAPSDLIPHRAPILLIDTVVSYVPLQTLHARRTFPESDPVFEGHFPGLPVLPGVLGVEALAQAAAALISLSLGKKHDEISFLFLGVEGVKFRKPVFPTETIDLKVTTLQRRGNVLKFAGRIEKDGALITEVAGFTARYEEKR